MRGAGPFGSLGSPDHARETALLWCRENVLALTDGFWTFGFCYNRIVYSIPSLNDP